MKVYVVEMFETGERHYFGSKAAIFTKLKPEDIGVRYDNLRRFKFGSKDYSTDRCIIKLEQLVRKPASGRIKPQKP